MGGGRTGPGGGDENPATARNTTEQPTNDRDGAAPRGATALEDTEKETAEGTGGAEHLSAHFTGEATATIKSDTHLRRDYGKEVTAALVGGQDRAGPAPEEDGHGATGHGRNIQMEEGGNKTPRRARAEQATADR